MSNIEVLDNKIQVIIDTVKGDIDDVYVLSLEDSFDEPYIERLDSNPLDVMSYLLENDDIFFIRKVKIC